MITISRGIFNSLKYTIYENDIEVGTIKRSSMLSTFTITYKGQEWIVTYISFWKSDYKIMKDDEILATAKMKWGLSNHWTINFKNKTFLWEQKSFFSLTKYLKMDGSDKILGMSKQTGYFSGNWELDFPPNVDVWFQLSLFCLQEIANFRSNAAK